MRRILSIALLFMLLCVNTLAGSYVCQPDGTIRFAWTQYSQCCIFSIPQNPIAIYVLSASEANDAVMDANGWSLVADTKYYAFYPYTKIPTDFEHPTVVYTSQQQTGNGSTVHLSNYDFMTSHATSTTDACHFNFKHFGCILRLECTLKEAKTLKTLTLTTESKTFTTIATMDVTDGMLTPVERDSIMTLNVSDITIGEGENLVAYMMMSPTDLSDKQLTVTLTADDGTVSTAKVQGAETLAGHAYPLSLNMPAFRSMDEDENGKGDKDASLQAKRAAPTPAATATSIQNPTAYAPDFTPDEAHAFEQIVKILGDVNDDKEVMVNDAVMLINHYLNGQTGLLDPEVADVNGDGVISIADAVAIINIFLSK